MIRSCFRVIKRNFCVDSWQLVKDGSIITQLSPIDCLQTDESRSKRPKTQRLFGKRRNNNWRVLCYINGKIWRGDNEKRPHLKKKKILFHQDNAIAQSSIKEMVKLDSLGYEFLSHPLYSSDLSPSDYYLFHNLKRWLQEKRFHTNEEVISETETYFAEFDKSYYSKGIKISEDRWKKCISHQDDYIEE